MPMTSSSRRQILIQPTTDSPAATAELLQFNSHYFLSHALPPLPTLPLLSEPHVAHWQQYCRLAATDGGAAALQQLFFQFCFPIRPGISRSEAYRAATLRGIAPPPDQWAPPRFQDPNGLTLHIATTPAGGLPVVMASNREDFVTLVQVFGSRNEPEPVPNSMGACMISGFNNWNRIFDYRRRWLEATRPADPEAAWDAEFSKLIPQTRLYQDTFVLLGTGPYSNIDGVDLGYGPEDWLRLSQDLRLAHESVHYVGRRLLGRAGHPVLDEIIADFLALITCLGDFRAAWLHRFLGLEDFPIFRSGGRLENYRGRPALSEAAFAALGRMVFNAVLNLEAFYQCRKPNIRSPYWMARLILAVNGMGLEILGAADGAEALIERFEAVAPEPV